MQLEANADRLIDRDVLRSEFGIDYHKDYLARMSRSGMFPQPVRLSPRKLRYRASEVRAWIADRAAGVPNLGAEAAK